MANSGIDPSAEAQAGDAITGGTLNLTKTSTYIAAVAALGIGLNPFFDTLFPASLHPTAGVKAAVVIAIFAGWAFIVAADLLSRGWASSKKRAAEQLLAVPPNMTVDLQDGGKGVNVLAMRGGPGGGEAEFLVAKEGATPYWVSVQKVVVHPAA